MTTNDSSRSGTMASARALAGRLRRRLRRAGAPDEVLARLDRQHERIGATERDLARIGPQVAALEIRLEELRERVEGPAGVLDETTAADAAAVIAEVRREHAQVRARISAAVRYEERLEQLERRVADLTAARE